MGGRTVESRSMKDEIELMRATKNMLQAVERQLSELKESKRKLRRELAECIFRIERLAIKRATPAG